MMIATASRKTIQIERDETRNYKREKGRMAIIYDCDFSNLHITTTSIIKKLNSSSRRKPT